MIVVDASALVDALLKTPGSTRIAARLFDSTDTLHAPHLIDIEVAQVFRRYVATRQILAARGLEAVEDLASLAMRRYPHRALLGRIWDLRHNLTAYDATYIALAERLSAPLVTRDQKLATASGHHARIELL